LYQEQGAGGEDPLAHDELWSGIYTSCDLEFVAEMVSIS
jgi:hypothetical protein